MIRHLTTKSWNLTSAAGSSATASGASARSPSSARNEFVRGQCSRSLSMSTLRALTSCGPSSILGTFASSSLSRSAATVARSFSCPTDAASVGSWNTCIMVLSTYLHARVVDGPGAATAASKIGDTRAASDPTSASQSGAIARSASASPTAAMTSWHRDFMPSTATASLTLVTESNDRVHPAIRTSTGGISSVSGSGAAGPGEARSLRPGSTDDTVDTIACTGRNTADAIAAIGDELPFSNAIDLDTDGTAAAAAPPTRTPPLVHAPGAPSFFRSISLAAFANLSSSASRSESLMRPRCLHASSPPTLYAVVRHAKAAFLAPTSRAPSASLATSASALFPARSTTSRPWRSIKAPMTSRTSRRVLMFFESRPRTRYPATFDAG